MDTKSTYNVRDLAITEVVLGQTHFSYKGSDLRAHIFETFRDKTSQNTNWVIIYALTMFIADSVFSLSEKIVEKYCLQTSHHLL